MANLLGFSKNLDYFDNYFRIEIGKKTQQMVGPFCAKTIDVPSFNGEYSDCIGLIKLIGLKRKELNSELVIHQQVCSSGGFNITKDRVLALKEFFKFHANELKGLKKIILKQWNTVHDRNFLTNLGGFRLGLGLQNNKDTDDTGFSLLDWETCNSIRLKYSQNGSLGVEAKNLPLHIKGVVKNSNSVTLYER
ncbi:hypothetical protein N9E34_01515 [Opitutales bacterium]|nr:hypothetical protein [Opitutales bacterium]